MNVVGAIVYAGFESAIQALKRGIPLCLEEIDRI